MKIRGLNFLFIAVSALFIFTGCGEESGAKSKSEKETEQSQEKVGNQEASESEASSEEKEVSEITEEVLAESVKAEGEVEEAAVEKAEEKTILETVELTGLFVWDNGGDRIFSIRYQESGASFSGNDMSHILKVSSGEIQIPTIGRGYGGDIQITEEKKQIGSEKQFTANRKMFSVDSQPLLVQYLIGEWNFNISVSGKELSQSDINLFDQMALTLEIATEEDLKEYKLNHPPEEFVK